MKRAGLVAGVAACVLLLCVCGGFVSASRDVRGGQIYFESAPEDEFLTPAQQAEAEIALRDRAAKLQAAAEARAIAERQEHMLPSGIAAMLEAGNDEAAPLIPQNVPGSPEAQLEAQALGPADPETERLTHIFSEEQFDEPHLPALSSLPPLDTSFLGLGSHQFLSQQAHQEVNAAVSADIAAAAEAALGAEAAVDADLDSEIAAEAQAETHESLKTEAALEAEQAFMSEEQYPSLIETQAQPMFVEQNADSSAQNAQTTATQQTAAVEQAATAEQTMQAELAAAANAAAEARVQSELDAEEALENREMAHVDNALATEMAMSFEEEYPSMIEQQGAQAADAQSAAQSASDAAAEADVQSQLDAEEAAENHELAEVDEALAAENALDSEEQYPTMIEQQGEQAHSVQTGAESASDAAAETEVQSELDAEEAAENRELAEVDTALAAENALATEEEYPSMLEIAATTPRRQLHYPAGVQHSIKGVMTRLRGKIAAAAARQKEADQQAVAQSPRALLATSSKAGHGARAKAGDQWWLQQAPWFLPPPPEWGPMPVTMYTSYYHKPTPGPQHLDYAHGIPLPHAEQLGMARRTYPQPPYEQPLPLDMGLMEVSSESHAATDAEAETEVEAGTEVDAEGAAMAEMQSELDAAAEEGLAIEAEELATAREVLEAEMEAEALDDDE